MRQSQEGKEVYLRGGAAGGGGGWGARYIHACYAISYCYLHTCIYSSSVFRNTSGACSSSNAHSVVIAILLGGARPPPTGIRGGGAIAPLPPLCRRPCTYCTLIGTKSQSPHGHRGLDCTSQCVWYVHYIMTHDSGHFNDVCSWMDLHYTWHIPKAGSAST